MADEPAQAAMRTADLFVPETGGERFIPFPPHVWQFLHSMQVPGVLSTLGRRGEPITSAVWYGMEADAITVATPAARNKARNARTDPRVSFIVDTKVRPYSGVAVEGIAVVDSEPNLEAMLNIARRYLGDEVPDDVRQRFISSERVILRIRPLRIRPWNLAPPEGQ